MTPQVAAALISALGVLSGVVVGSLLSGWHQRRALTREQTERSNDERRKIFAAFLTSAREWRAASVRADTELVSASAVSFRPHADGGAAATRTLGLRSEVALVAQPQTIRAAFAMAKALGKLAEARADHAAGTLPEELFVACRMTEVQFTVAAREELGFAGSETEIRELYLGVGKPDSSTEEIS